MGTHNEGHGKNGKPYKIGNTREDGSYAVGKSRPPTQTRFAVNDGRKRGRRPKGQRNFDSDWAEELERTVKVIKNGKEIRTTAHRAQVMKTMELGSKGKERSQELIFRQAERVQQSRRQANTQNDERLIAAWLEQQQDSAFTSIVGDDAEATLPNGEGGDGHE
jgi:hypothetical protein